MEGQFRVLLANLTNLLCDAEDFDDYKRIEERQLWASMIGDFVISLGSS